jgi:hypothetical protein
MGCEWRSKPKVDLRQGTQTIKSMTQNLVFDVKGGSLNQGGQVIAWPPNNGPNQKWKLVKV